MSSSKLLSEWYGYDKEVKAPTNKYSNIDLGYTSRSYSGREYVLLSPEGAEAIKKLPSEIRSQMIQAWYPASDGLTDDDFYDWVYSGRRIAGNDWSNWRYQEVERRNPKLQISWDFGNLVNNFFKYGQRSDRLFRIIEMNEFLHTAEETQTFEDFLTTNKEFKDKCKNIELTKHSKLTSKLYEFDESLPKFLKFGGNTTIKVKEELLKLTRSEFEKLFEWETNPYKSSATSDGSLIFAKLYISAALGDVKRVEIRELTGPEVKNTIMAAFLSGSENFWNSLGAKRDVATATEIVLDELRKVSFNSDEMKRGLSYLISTGVLKKLTPVEVIAVTLGYDKSARWAEPNKGETTIEVATKMMIENKLDPEFFAKLVAYIIINNLDLIVVDEELLDHTFEEVPIVWAYPLIKQSNKKRKLVHPKAIQILI